MLGYFFVAMTVLLTIYGQLVLKWRVGLAGQVPDGVDGKVSFLLHTLMDPWTISGLAAAFLASLFWMLALTKLDLSEAYPFTAISFVLVLVSSVVMFGESPNMGKIAGTLLVAIGIIIVASSSQ
jgi:multidrug transporter EmrE-like cation transporter